MERPTLLPASSIHYGGYHYRRHVNTERYMGPPSERTCIYLTKPRNTALKIISLEEEEAVGIQGGPLEYNLPVSIHARSCGPYRVVGTTNTNTLKLHSSEDNRLQSPFTPHSAIGFRDRLGVSNLPKEKRASTKHVYAANVADLSAVLETEGGFGRNNGIELHPMYVACVVEEKNRPEVRPLVDHIKTTPRIGPLDQSPLQEEQPIMSLFKNHLPLELKEIVLSHLDYDQVSCLADTDKTFARMLAKSRYKIADSYDTNRYPDTGELLRLMRLETAKEMQLRGKEELWAVSLEKQSDFYGEAKRYLFQKGTYSWHLASSITSMRFDSNRSKCRECTSKLVDLQNKMSANQQAVLSGRSSIKVFALKGTESVDLDYGFASPLSEEDPDTRSNYRYAIHLWVENLDNRWLLDLRRRGRDAMHAADYRYIQNAKTLIFKDPVKFFGTSKVMERIDGGIVAITSEKTGETLGYLVNDREFRFRLPHEHGRRSHFIGLNFLPDTLLKETVAMDSFTGHVIEHEVGEKLAVQESRLSDLKQIYRNTVVDNERLREILNNEMNDAHRIFRRLLSIKIRRHKLLRTHVFQEISLDENTLHIHDSFEEDVDICCRYIFHSLGGESRSDKRMAETARQMFSRCSCERRDLSKICSLSIVSPAVLRSVYAVLQEESSETDFV